MLTTLLTSIIPLLICFLLFISLISIYSSETQLKFRDHYSRSYLTVVGGWLLVLFIRGCRCYALRGPLKIFSKLEKSSTKTITRMWPWRARLASLWFLSWYLSSSPITRLPYLCIALMQWLSENSYFDVIKLTHSIINRLFFTL